MEELYYNSTMLTSFLLGKLSQAEQELFEERFFSDNDLFIELLDAKDQLMSDYLNGRLAPDDRGRFEKRFLTSPECRRELQLAHFLTQPSTRQQLRQPSGPRPETASWWQVILDTSRVHRPLVGLAITALLVLGLFSFWRWRQPPVQSSQPSIASSTKSGPAVASFILKPSLTRSDGGVPTVKIDSGTQVVELILGTTQESYSSYRASIRKEGETAAEFVTDDNLKAEWVEGGKQAVIVKVPASKLSVNDYQAILEGVIAGKIAKTIGTYHFKVREQ